MYETEANCIEEPAESIPTGIVSEFGRRRAQVIARTVLPWSEHCTECVWPTCYTSCDLYSPREDGRCRRFVDGMARVDCATALNGYLLKIRFKQWGKLWTPGNLRLYPQGKAAKLERRDYWIGTIVNGLLAPAAIRNVAIQKRYSWKKRVISHAAPTDDNATAFVLECYNPNDRAIKLSLTMRPMKREQKISYQQLLVVGPGISLVRIPCEAIARQIDLRSPFNIELIPNEFESELTLYFGLMEFVRDAYKPVEADGKVKCLVWDLDQTLWDGVLVEDGVERLVLRTEIRELIEEADRRGILQSIASKNNVDEAMAVLRHFGLEETFLVPQISWAPKSEGIERIAQRLNVGIDSLIFIDDQQFERSQVEAACAGIRTLDVKDALSLRDTESFQQPITDESRSRRRMYMVEQERQKTQSIYRDDYSAFLKDCDIHLSLRSLSENNLERVHELTQRTNQMNFSGTRYDREVLREIIQRQNLDTYVISCEDRFGSYGIVGFGIFDTNDSRLTDLMFSCRVQSKRVEHAFLGAIISRYVRTTGRDFYADYRKTPRNAPSGQVFQDLGMVELKTIDGMTSLLFSKDRLPLSDDIATVNFYEEAEATSRS